MWAHNASALVTVECAIELAGFGVALTLNEKTKVSEAPKWQNKNFSASKTFVFGHDFGILEVSTLILVLLLAEIKTRNKSFIIVLSDILKLQFLCELKPQF